MSHSKTNEGLEGSLLGQEISLTIEKLAVGGYGLGRYNGIVVFVPFSAPEDDLVVKVIEHKSNHAFAEIIQITKESPQRAKPACPYYFECGGCNWQHIGDSFQLKHKENLVRENLKKFLRFEVAVLPIIPSPNVWRYRNRIQLAHGQGKIGFRKRRSHDIINIEDCLITEESITKNFGEIRKALGPSEGRLELYLNESGEVAWNKADEKDETLGFSQVNRFQNETLVKTLLEWGQPETKNLLELYAGSGNFTWPLANKYPNSSLVAVELNPRLVEKALLQQKAFPKVRFIPSDVETFLRSWSLATHDMIFLDPPRQGANEFIMRSLAWSQARQILYLSCHPVTLARDLGVFLKESNRSGRPFRIARVQPFEMFPQTDHVETLVELRVD